MATQMHGLWVIPSDEICISLECMGRRVVAPSTTSADLQLVVCVPRTHQASQGDHVPSSSRLFSIIEQIARHMIDTRAACESRSK